MVESYLMEEFITWLEEELNRRDWQPADLARKANLGNSTITRILGETRKAGPEVCVAIAQALGEPPEKVFRLAGLLPPSPEPANGEDQLLIAFRQLPSQQQRFLLDMLRGSHGQLIELPVSTNLDTAWPDEPSPDMEDIANIVQHLDELERRLVFDYARWRLAEQGARRNSTGKRQGGKKRKEREEIIGLIDLYLAVDEAPQEKIDSFIAALTEWYFLQQENEQESDSQIVASQSPQHNSGQSPQQDQE